jgi:hypothetical protein
MRKYEVLKEHPDLPANSPVGKIIELDDYAKECALVESGVLKSLNQHSGG